MAHYKMLTVGGAGSQIDLRMGALESRPRHLKLIAVNSSVSGVRDAGGREDEAVLH